MKQLTKEQAIEFSDLKSYEALSMRQIAEFQIEQDKLCMPFSVFHEAIEKTIGRPVFTHEFGVNREGIKKEIFNGAKPPTLEQIIEMIPESKRIIITA